MPQKVYWETPQCAFVENVQKMSDYVHLMTLECRCVSYHDHLYIRHASYI